MNMRVVRGPDWRYGDNDGGEGSVGTIIKEGGVESDLPAKSVLVQWDSGKQNNCRVGFENAYDLRLLDNSQNGLQSLANCDFCKTEMFKGMRWMCLSCYDYDLCTSCYMAGKHDLSHPFLRFQTSFSNKKGVAMPIREGATQMQVKGIYKDSNSPIARMKVYKLKYEGKLDLECILNNEPHKYYKDHLPILGLPAPIQNLAISLPFNVGDEVQLLLKDIAEIRYKKGKVDMILSREHVLVQLEDILASFPATVLEKVPTTVESNDIAIEEEVPTMAEGNNYDAREEEAPLEESVSSDDSSSDSEAGDTWVSLKQPQKLETKDYDFPKSTLHYYAYNDMPKQLESAIKNGTDVNMLNKDGRTALHVAIVFQNIRCIEVLLKYKADVNIQDKRGDTALLDAIDACNQEIIEMLLDVANLNLTLQNQDGMNALHLSTLTGNLTVVGQILTKAPRLINVENADGNSVLHLASQMGRFKIARFLLSVENCDIDSRNNEGETPLFVAIANRHYNLIELLVEEGLATINIIRNDGNTCLHITLMAEPSSTDVENRIENSSKIATIYHDLLQMSLDFIAPKHAVACYLVQCGADLENIENNRNQTPLDLFEESIFEDILKGFFYKNLYSGQEEPEEETKVFSECLMCNMKQQLVKFEPCNHHLLCVECCNYKMKNCILCKKGITKMIGPDGELSFGARAESVTINQLKEKIEEYEDAQNCVICNENPMNVAFGCGHRCCSRCEAMLPTCPKCDKSHCHMCRKPIEQRLTLY